MSTNSPSDGASDEIEIALDDGAELQLHEVEIDADGRPIEFTVEGVIRDVDSDVLAQLEGATLEPTAIRFRPVTDNE